MKYEQLKNLADAAFRRRTGVKFNTFCKMVGILKEVAQAQRHHGGWRTKLSISFFKREKA